MAASPGISPPAPPGPSPRTGPAASAGTYVRLKHALSALALDAVRGRPAARAAAAHWVALWAGASPGGAAPSGGPPAAAAPVPLTRGPTAAGVRRLLRDGLVARHQGTLVVPPAYAAHRAYAQRHAQRLALALQTLQALRARHFGRLPRGRRGAAATGAVLFNTGLFFECHEFFEGIWRRAPAADRPCYQGIILVAAAFYHYEKGNLHGARVKLAEGTKRLRRCAPARVGLQIGDWLQRLEPWLARIARGEPGRPLEAHQIPAVALDDGPAVAR